jgi:hypothetical protein
MKPTLRERRSSYDQLRLVPLARRESRFKLRALRTLARLNLDELPDNLPAPPVETLLNSFLLGIEAQPTLTLLVCY